MATCGWQATACSSSTERRSTGSTDTVSRRAVAARALAVASPAQPRERIPSAIAMDPARVAIPRNGDPGTQCSGDEDVVTVATDPALLRRAATAPAADLDAIVARHQRGVWR